MLQLCHIQTFSIYRRYNYGHWTDSITKKNFVLVFKYTKEKIRKYQFIYSGDS